MEPVLPTIEALQLYLAEIDRVNDGGDLHVDVLRIQTQVFMHIAQELEQVNNNLEGLRELVQRRISDGREH